MHEGPTETFRTHANYIRAVATLAGGPVFPFKGQGERLADLANRIKGLKSLSDTPKAGIDENQVQRSLVNAWGSELLLGLAGAYGFEDELIRLTNNWGVVQCYYAAYHASQAYSVSKGGPRPDSHTKTQNEFMNHWVSRGLQLSPWTLGLDHTGYLNVPNGKLIDDKCSPWIGCNEQTAWDLYAKALRTTRQDRVDDALSDARDTKSKLRRKAWLDEETRRLTAGNKPRKAPSWPKPNLTADERKTTESRIRPFSLIDYLYRLRIKTNYVDASMFTEGPEDDQVSRTVHQDLQLICASNLMLHELHIGRLLSRGRILSWIDPWLGSNMPSGKTLGLARRRDILNGLL